jgi:hypothetical protein
MKRLLFLVSLVFLLNSCSMDDDSINYRYEILPVDSFEIPESFVFGQTYPIKIYYKRPTTCHGFDGFFYDSYMNTRTIAVQSIVVNQSNCLEISSEEPALEAVLNFKVVYQNTYLFKFYKGKDENGENIFEEVEVPVTD